MRAIYTRSSDARDGAVPVSQGGTGTRNPENLRNALNLVTESDKDIPGGVVPLNAQGKIPVQRLPAQGSASAVNVDGNFDLFVNAVTQFTITDYSSFKSYTVSFSAGNWTVNEDVIQYTAPATAQQVVMSINGREITFEVTTPQPSRPTILSPINGAVNQTQAPDIVGSLYSYNGPLVAHKDSTWQIATDSEFTNIISQSVDDAVNKTSWIPSVALSANTSYFARVRYRDTNNVSGAWSLVAQFNTKTSFVPLVEEAKIVAPDGVDADLFGGFGDGCSVSMDATGKRVAIGSSRTDYSGFTDQGAVYVFVRNGNTWSMEQKLTITDEATDGSFGLSVKIDSTGTRIVAGGYEVTSSGLNNAGKVYIFTRTDSVWSRERVVTAQANAIDAMFGIAVAINSDGSRIAIGNTLRRIEIYRRSGTTWVFEQQIVANDTDGVVDASFAARAKALAFDSNADRLVVGAPTGGSPGQTGFGAFYVFTRSGTTWAQEIKIVGSLGSNSLFGETTDIDSTGTRIVVAARNGARAYVYVRSGTTWTLENTFLQLHPTNPPGGYFAFHAAINSNGDVIVVSAFEAPSLANAANAGYVAVFKRNNSTWDSGTRLSASDEAAGFKFGFNIDISGDGNRLISSSPYQNNERGAAYVFA